MSKPSSYELQQSIHLAKVEKRAEELMKELIDLSNDISGKTQERVAKGMACGLLRSHRTLQQSTVANIKEAFVIYGATNSDARNEQAVSFAKQAGELPIHFPFI